MAQLQHISDEELFVRYKAEQNDRCLHELWKRYSHLIRAAAMKYVKDKECAKDIEQQVMQKIIELPIDYRIEKFASWIGVVVKNTSLMSLRHQHKVVPLSNEILSIEDEVLNREEDIQQMEKKLTLLNRAQQLCLRLFYLENKSYKEVGLISGYSQDEVKSHIQNGKRNMKNLLTKK
ncbi:MAG: RNA polymerase sigma factor [Flavobacteriales bacterium]|jgi:RNA polymerase sigma factor (sigma-70 family)